MTQWHTLQQDWGENQTRRRNEGEEGREKKSGAGCAPKNQGEKQRGKRGAGERGEGGGATMEKRVHLTSARMCSSHATMPCCCVRSGGGGGCVHPCPCQCVAMSSTASHAIMMSCLCASVFSSQPSLSACLCAFVCAGSISVRAAGAGAHNQKKRRESACV